MKTAILSQTQMRWLGLAAIALAELTLLAIRVEVPATGLLSFFKGFPSIFVTSFAVVAVLGWVGSRRKLLEFAVFGEFSHSSWLMGVAHVAAFIAFFALTIYIVEGEATSSSLAVSWMIAWAQGMASQDTLLFLHNS